MKTNKINKALKHLYKTHWGSYLNAWTDYNNHHQNRKGANIYLLQASNNYCQSAFRIMFFGKETNGWEVGDNKYNPTVIELMKWYDSEVNGKKINTPFHVFINRFLEDYGNMYNMGCILNNVVKIGKLYGKKGFYKEPFIQDLSRKLLKEEIDILKPNLIVCLFNDDVHNNVDYVELFEKVMGVNGVNTVSVEDISCNDPKYKRCQKVIYANYPKIPVLYLYHPEGKSNCLRAQFEQLILKEVKEGLKLNIP